MACDETRESLTPEVEINLLGRMENCELDGETRGGSEELSHDLLSTSLHFTFKCDNVCVLKVRHSRRKNNKSHSHAKLSGAAPRDSPHEGTRRYTKVHEGT